MRETRYRVWDKDRNEYLSAGSVFIEILPRSRPDTSPIHLDVITHPDEYRERLILEQFTGLKDKNDIDIFEGDLFQIAGNHTFHIRYAIGMEEDHYEYYGACFLLCAEHVKMPFDEWALEHGEVVGNIHENSYLL